MSKRRRRGNDHVALRVAQRHDEPEVDFVELERRVKAMEFQFLRRQTNTRTLCKTLIGGHDVFFIYDRKNKCTVTVLTREMADDQL